jgi:hypothetical protein
MQTTPLRDDPRRCGDLHPRVSGDPLRYRRCSSRIHELEMPKENCTSTHAAIRTVQTGSRATLVAICVVLVAAGASTFLPAAHAVSGRPASLGPNVRIKISALRGRSLPRDSHCSAFAPVAPQLATVAVDAHCGRWEVRIDNEGGSSNGCTYVTWIAREPPYWDCHVATLHIEIQSVDLHKSLAEKRLREAITLVLRVSQVGR